MIGATNAKNIRNISPKNIGEMYMKVTTTLKRLHTKIVETKLSIIRLAFKVRFIPQNGL